MSDTTSFSAFIAILAHIGPQQAQPLPSQALLARDRNLGVENLAQVAGREAETRTFEKRVVLAKTRLGGHVPRGGAPAVPWDCPYAQSQCGMSQAGSGLKQGCPWVRVGREGIGQRDLPAQSRAG